MSRKKLLTGVLREATWALYFVYENGDSETFDRSAYEQLAVELQELIEKIEEGGGL